MHGVIEQVEPEYPDTHEQEYLLPFNEHVPPFKQGFEEQGVVSHVVPEYPFGHMQFQAVELSIFAIPLHVPPFRHGEEVQGFGNVQNVPIQAAFVHEQL